MQNSLVYIKSYKNGLKVYLDENCSFVDICNEVKEKVSASKNFFKGGKIAIDFEGRTLSDEEELLLIRIFEACGEMTILYVVGKDSKTEEQFLKAINKPIVEFNKNESVGKIYSGNIKNGDTITTDSSVVVMGDVEPGAKLISKGNIIVLGGIYGTCKIECDEHKGLFIFGNDVNAECLEIGDYVFKSKEKPKWVVKPKMVPKICYVKDLSIELLPVSGAVLRTISDYMNR